MTTLEKVKNYEIRADARQYVETSVDMETGRMGYIEHEFEGQDFIAYKIVDDNCDTVIDDIETFEEAKQELKKLNKNN